MRERLTRADLRFLIVCALLLAGTVWFSAKYFYRAFPEASIDFQVTRGDARSLAEKFLTSLGQSISGYRHAARFSFDDESKTFLERELGLEEANRLMGTRIRLWRWSNRWFRPQQKEEFRVDITPRGETVGFSHLIPETAAKPAMAVEQARGAAEEFLRSVMRRDPATLDFVEASSLARPARTDHVFTWKERDFEIRDATYRIEVTMLGSEVGGYREYLKVPEKWLRDYERLRSRNQTAQTIDSAVVLLLALGLLVTLLRRIMSHDVRWKLASGFACVGAVLLFFSSWNAQPLAEFSYPTTDSYSSFVARQFLQALLGAVAGGGLLFILTAAAEPVYRQWCGSHLSLSNMFRARGLRTKRFFRGSVLGVTLTGVFVAYQIAFYLIAYRFGAWSPADVPYNDLLNTHLPWLFVLLGGFLPAVSEEFLFRMFAIPFLARMWRSTWLGLILAGFIWGFGHAGYPQQPFFIRGLEVGIGGVVLGVMMLRFGILPTLVWHYSVDALYTALLLLRSHNMYFILSGAASAGIMVLPLAIAWIAYWRGKGFEPETELTNEREGSAAPREEVRAEPAAVVEYRPWPKHVIAAALLAAAAAAAFLLVPADRFGDEPRFALDSAQARVRGDAFLRTRGLDPSGFRTVTWPETQLDARTAKYFLERRPVSFLREAYTRYVPLRAWIVRYYKPLQKEEVRVWVNPESGVPTGFHHSLPEDQAGADLPAPEARRIAADYLKSQGIDLEKFELKETSSEKRKARRDHTLVWEAHPGDARNLDEARFRVRAQVAGDRVVLMSTFWKLPETFLRARSQRNALSIAIVALTAAFTIAAVVFGIIELVRATRRRKLRWRSAVIAALPITAVVAAGQIADMPLLFRNYNTALTLETFRALIVTGALTAAVGAFIMATGAAAVILALNPGALAALRATSRRVMARDALLALALAAALFAGFTHFRALLTAQFHVQALISGGGSSLAGSAVPALSAIGSAAFSAVFMLAFLALAALAVIRLRRRAIFIVLIAMVAVAAGVSSEAHTAGEFLLQYVVSAVAVGFAALFSAWFARNNLLAFALAAWTIFLGRAGLSLLSQPAASLRLQGWIVMAVLAVTLFCAFLPALKREPS